MTNIAPINPPGRTGIARTIRIWWGQRPLVQIVLVAGLALLLGALGYNIVNSMHRLGMTPGFGYLWQPASFDITEALIPYSAGNSYARAILVGFLNTIKLAFFSCILATLLGVPLGIMRLSGNLLLSRLVQAYVEIVRNTPLTLHLFFWILMTHALPSIRQALQPLPSTFLSIRGVFLPWFRVEDGDSLWLLLLVLIGLGIILRIALKRRDYPLSVPALAGIVAIFPLVAGLWILFFGVVVTPDLPVLQGFNIHGGLTMTPEFAAMLTGLTIYYAASISESVRSGIESVDAGQWEAARSIGLPGRRIMRLIILPQAMRVITPLMTSSYLDITKDTTLGILIGFTELLAVINVSANNVGNAVETVIVLIGVFLSISLPVSFLINLHNSRLRRRGIIAR